jgi:hypothetical protein
MNIIILPKSGYQVGMGVREKLLGKVHGLRCRVVDRARK